MSERIEQKVQRGRESICPTCYHRNVCLAIGNQPCFGCNQYKNAADVVEVKHGRWEDRPTGRYCQTQSWCTACGKHSGIGGIESNRHKPYCPNCGAKMDGGADNAVD